MLFLSPGRDRIAASKVLSPGPVLLGGPDLAAAVDLRLSSRSEQEERCQGRNHGGGYLSPRSRERRKIAAMV